MFVVLADRLEDCQNLKHMSPENRWFTREKKFCDNCLYLSHFAWGCTSKPACTIDGCGRNHHTLLHTVHSSNSGNSDIQVKQTAIAMQSSSNVVFESTGQATGSTEHNEEGNTEPLGHAAGSYATEFSRVRVYLRVVPVIVKGPDRAIETLALLDNGSQISLCTKKLFDSIGLKGQERPLTMTTINGVKHFNALEFNVTVKSITGDDVIEMSVTAVDSMPVSCILPSTQDIAKWSHLQNIAFQKPASGNTEVLLLIGVDVPEVFWVLEERCGRKRQPYAIKSILG